MVHAAFLRSEVARARITRLDTTAAEQLEGVRAIFTGSDLNPDAGRLYTTSSGPNAPHPPERPLADGDVRFVGDPIAVVVAESRYIAEDALDLIELDLEVDDPVLGFDNPVLDAAPLVHPELGTNVAAEIPAFPNPNLDEAFARATHTVTRTFEMARATDDAPMEAAGSHPGTGKRW